MGNEPSQVASTRSRANTRASRSRSGTNTRSRTQITRQISRNPSRNQIINRERSHHDRVKCPNCRRLLNVPEGVSRFRCPCSQILMAPTEKPKVHVKCPRCATTLTAPPGVKAFRCSCCGAALKAPNSRQRPTRGIAIDNPNKDAPNGGGGKFVNENLLPDEIAAQVRKPNEEYWVRTIRSDGKLYWVRHMSEEKENEIRELLASWKTDMEQNIRDLSVADIELRLDQMGLSDWVEENADKAKLSEAMLKAKDHLLATTSQEEIIRRLNDLIVEHTNCQDKEDYVERLVAAAWYGPTKFADGFVRQFTGQFDLSIIPAQQFGLDLEYKKYKLDPHELERVSRAPFKDKVKWFKSQCNKSRIKWEDGRVQIKIRRDDLLRDSFNNVNRMKPKDFRRYLRFEFIGEDGIDAGALAREWFEQVTDACFNVDCGLFEYSGVDNICYQFNPASGIANELHESYFHFLGRVVGKALFDHKFIRAHVTQPIYKHILGCPITMEDIQFSDNSLYESLKSMEKAEDISEYLMTFTTAVESFGHTEEIELKENGGEIDVTNRNLQEYLQLVTKYYMFERTKSQLAHFLRGLYDVIPPIWLSVFDHRELELLLCGLPNINVKDWKSHTRYRGVYQQKGENHKVIKWFWDVVEASTQEQRAMILQYCTGTSRVPVGGFAALQGNDGNIKPFTIDSAKLSDVLFPKAHTCFNRIELPTYKSKDEMIRRFEEALKQGTIGFTDE